MTSRSDFFKLHEPPTPVFRTNKPLTVVSYQWEFGCTPYANEVTIELPEYTEIKRINYSAFDDGYSMGVVDAKTVPGLKKMKASERKGRWFVVKYEDMEFDGFR